MTSRKWAGNFTAAAVRTKLLYLSTNKDVKQRKGTNSASWCLNIPITHVSYTLSVNRGCILRWGVSA